MMDILSKINDNYVLEKKDILKIVELFFRENHLELYLNDIVFDNNSKYLGAYSIKDKKIILNDDKIIKSCYKFSDRLQKIYHIDENYYNYFLNYYYLYILFHELEHVKQVKKFYDHGTLLYQFLYDLCQRLHYNNPDFYHKNHDFFPMEIDANNNGYLRAYNFFSHTNLPIRDLEIMHAQYLFSLLYNYDKIGNKYISSPINKLCIVDKRINKDLIHKLVDMCKPTEEERLNLGLNITPHEYNSINNEKRKIILLKK